MATRGWGGSIALAVGLAAGAAAAQLGVVYGLGIMSWTGGTDPAGESAWLASLAWTTWIAATSTVIGAVEAGQLSAGAPGVALPRRRPGATSRIPAASMATGAWRLVIALTAAVGGLLTVALVAVPARAAHRPETYAPQMIAGGYAIVGVAVGTLVAVAALSARPIAVNVVLTTAYMWALAIASVIFGIATHHGLTTAQLGVWRFGSGHFQWQTFSLPFSPPGAAQMMGAALLLGVLTAWPAMRRGDNKVGVAIAGAVGPFLVAAAYFLAAPELVGVPPNGQLSAYLIAPYAVLAGLAGSVLYVALAAQREQQLAQQQLTEVEPHPTDRATVPVPDESLPDDAYAPARAYDDEPAPALVSSPGVPPLWPSQPEPSDETTQPGKGSDHL
jgi:hypothetical protein